MTNFCVDAQVTNPKCYSTETFKFSSEESIFDILLDVFKSELPPLLYQELGCDGKPLIISEDSIDIVPNDEDVRFKLVLNPLSAIPDYADSLIYRTVEHDFEFILTASNTELKCVTWELIKLKNVVETLLIGTEFAIDGYDSVTLESKGFNYFIPTRIPNGYLRQGSYRFSVTVTQYKIN